MNAVVKAKAPLGEESTKRRLERIKGSLCAAREVYIPLWRDLADNFLPFRGRWLNEQPNQKIRRNLKIINNHPLRAQRTFAAGMQAGVTSPARPWFRLKPSRRGLIEAEGVREWLYEVETELRNLYSQANFYSSMRACYSEYGVFGTLALGVFEDDTTGMHCCAYTIGSYYISINDKGVVDTFAQEFKWTVRQIVQRWVKDPKNPSDPGWATLSDTVRQSWDRNQRETYVDMIYMVLPNNDRQLGKLDASGMPFLAYYYEAGRQSDDKVIETRGYREFPIMVARLATNEGDSYGTGLGVDCLGDAKALQFHEKRFAQVVDKETDPPMKAHPSLRNQPASQLPGDITYIEPGVGNVGMEPLSVWKPDREGTLISIQAIEQRIDATMFADIFALFIQGEDKEETATKTDAKQQEKLLMLGPVLEDIIPFLNKFIDRSFSVALRQAMLPPPPDALQGQPLKIEYVSILAQAQNLVAVDGVNRFVGYVMGLAAQQAEMGQEPTALDKLDIDQSIDEYGNLSGVVPTIIRNDEDVAALRDSRAKAKAQAMQQQQAAEMIPAAAKAAKDLGTTPMGTGSALDAVAAGLH